MLVSTGKQWDEFARGWKLVLDARNRELKAGCPILARFLAQGWDSTTASRMGFFVGQHDVALQMENVIDVRTALFSKIAMRAWESFSSSWPWPVATPRPP